MLKFSYICGMDVLTTQQRHKNMASIRSTNTKPEILVRKYLWRQGFRYRLNGHDGCKYFRLPKTNTDFWEKKINRNKERDKEEQRQLAKMGWHCITVWECELKPKVRDKTLESLAYTLNHIYLEDRSVKYKLPKEEDIQIAAEPKLFM